MEIMVNQTHDGHWVNEVANHPAVRPFIAHGDSPLDLSSVVESTDNIVLRADNGCFVCNQHMPGVYEVHTLFLPEGRESVCRIAKEAARWMFTRTECSELLTQVPITNRQADILARRAGFCLEFEGNGFLGPTKFYALRYADWVKNAGMEIYGQAFHQRLHAIRGFPPGHGDDPAHDRYVGAAVATFPHQPAKAIYLYNKWARFAGYHEIKFVPPNHLDIGDGIIDVKDFSEISPCQ